MWENSLLNLSFQPEFLTCERGMVDGKQWPQIESGIGFDMNFTMRFASHGSQMVVMSSETG